VFVVLPEEVEAEAEEVGVEAVELADMVVRIECGMALNFLCAASNSRTLRGSTI
jgi:hypothetical protein